MKKVIMFCIIMILLACQDETFETVNEVVLDNKVDYSGISDIVNLYQSDIHKGRIYTSDSNEDYLVVGSADGSLSLWSHEGELLHHKLLHHKGVEEVEIHDAVYSISDDNRLIKTGIENFESEVLYEGLTKEFTLSSDLSLIAISSGDSVNVYKLDNFDLISSFQWTDGCFDVRFGPNNQYLYNVGHEGLVEKYEIPSGQVVMRYEGLNFDVHCLEITRDGAYIIAGATDAYVAIWEEEGALLKKYRHMDGLYDVALSLDDHYIASVGVDKSVNIVELSSGVCLKQIKMPDELHTVTFTDKGLVTGGYDGIVYFYGNKTLTDFASITLSNLSQVEEMKLISAHKEAAFCLAITHDCEILATSSFDKTLKLWDVKTGRLIEEVQFDEMAVDLTFTEDDKILIYKGEQGKLLFYEMDKKLMTLKDESVGSIALSHDEKLIAVGKRDGSIHLATFPDLKEIRSYKALDFPVFQLAFSKDDTKLFFAYAGSTDVFTTTALDLETYDILYDTQGHDGYNYDIKTSESYLITSGADHNIKYWDINDGSQVKVLSEHSGKVMDVFISSDESWMVSCSAHGRSMRLWDFQTGELIKTFRPGTEVQDVVISNEDKFIAAIGVDGKVRIYGIE